MCLSVLTYLKDAGYTQVIEDWNEYMPRPKGSDDKGHRDPPIHRAVHVYLSRRAQDRYS